MEKETLQDSVIMGDKTQINHGELASIRAFTEEEKMLEKKLLRKIDSLILPMVVLIYLMNYIDRYARDLCSAPSSITTMTDADVVAQQEQLSCCTTTRPTGRPKSHR